MSLQRKTITLWVLVFSVLFGSGISATGQVSSEDGSTQVSQVQENWDDLMHYALIGRFDLAQQYGQALLDLDPKPTEIFGLTESDTYENPYQILDRMQTTPTLKEIARQVRALIEAGRYAKRTDTQSIQREVDRLTSNPRARKIAMERLKDSGEWAVPVLIQALRNSDRSEDFIYFQWALPQIGRVAVHPLATALEECDELNVRLSILETLGKIGYPSASPYILAVMENKSSQPELKSAALKALQSIQGSKSARGLTAAAAFESLAQDYYNHLSSLAVPANQELANVWFWDDQEGLIKEEVPRDAFDELMTMRCCEKSVKLDPHRAGAISLWLSAFFRLESQGFSQPAYFGKNHADGGTYALTAGPEYLHRCLHRALKNRNRPVALSSIAALRRNSGQQSLLYSLGKEQPLISALRYPDREIRFSAALTVGGVLPKQSFIHQGQVVPIIVEALRQKGQRFAIVVDSDTKQAQKTAASLLEQGQFTTIIRDEHLGNAMEQAKRIPSIDLVVLSYNIEHPDIQSAVSLTRDNYRLAFCPTIVLADDQSFARARTLKEHNEFLEVLPDNSPASDVLQAAQEILTKNQVSGFDPQLADFYASAAADVLNQLSVTCNPVLDLKVAEPALVEAIRDERKYIQAAVTETLAYLDSMMAQRTIASLALDEQVEQETRLMAFRNLAISAKRHGNLLLGEQVRDLYRLVGSQSQQADPELRNMAAEAYGSLNLPSAQISQLITDQMK